MTISPLPRALDPEKLLGCVHCGLCLTACPTYLETGNEADSPRGRIHLMRGLADGRISLDTPTLRHLDLCLGCRACETACPSGVPYGSLLEHARATLEPQAKRTGLDRGWRRFLATTLPKPGRSAALRPLLALGHATGVAKLAAASWLPMPVRRSLAMMPDAAGSAALPAVVEPRGAMRGTVALLTGCVARSFFPEVHRATAGLLALAGWRVVAPEGQVCCGALPGHLGDAEQSERLLKRNVGVFERTGADWIVSNAAGCGAWLRESGHRVEAGDPFHHAAAALGAKVRDVTELLEEGLPVPTVSVPARVAYHDACHLAHGQGVRSAPRKLLAAIPGVELVEIAEPDVCCGSAGTYNLTEPAMAWRLGERKASAVADAKPDMVAAGNPGCTIQIRAALRLRGVDLPVLHTAQILARAHGLEDRRA